MNFELNRPQSHDRIINIVSASLDEARIDHEIEYVLTDGARADIFYDGIVLEIKSIVGIIDDDKLDRYEAQPEVDQVVLVLPEAMAVREADRERRVISVDRETFTLSL